MPADYPSDCPLAARLADLLVANRNDLTERWLRRITARVQIEENRVFPTDELLDHMPLLLEGIAEYMRDPAAEIAADVPVYAKARELGELRHEQGFDAYEILKEYELLGGILFAFLSRAVDEVDEPCTRSELLTCAHRMFRAISIIQHSTLTQYSELSTARVREREQRLRAFNVAISHELKNRIGAVLGAGDLILTIDSLGPDERRRFARMVVVNAREMQNTLANLLDLTRLEHDSRRQRHVALPEVCFEVVRRLREMAAARSVQVAIDPDIPKVEVNAAAMELVLTNLVSNAIKYSDPAREPRWVRLGASVEHAEDDEPRLTVRVSDNGMGIPVESRPRLFQRFFRAHGGPAQDDIEGTGLGLSIVRDTVESMTGRVWAEFPAEGTVFVLSMPCRRRSERQQVSSATT